MTHLDISIPKYNPKKHNFFDEYVNVYQKTDGVKLTVLKTDNDFIIAYKGNLLYKEEYNYAKNNIIRNESIGSSQFKIAIEHFESIDTDSIKPNTEFFIEYLIKKPTLATHYTSHHNLVLIGYSENVTYDKELLKYGKLIISNNEYNDTYREDYASILEIDTPNNIFSGIPSKNFNTEELFFDVLTKIPSKYGNQEEGIIVTYNKTSFKIQNDLHHDKEHRSNIKNKYRENTPEQESQYWNTLYNEALEITNTYIDTHNTLERSLEMTSDILKVHKCSIHHSKKTSFNILDDLQLTIKNIIIKRLSGNNNAAIIGKFRVLTNGHVKVISEALKTHDKVIIFLVSNKKSKENKDFREKMLKDVYNNKIEIIHCSNANIVQLINKCLFNINSIYCGSDRLDEYVKQLRFTKGVTIEEIHRSDDDISATRLLSNIEDYTFFKNNTPSEIHHSYNEIINNF